MLNQTLIDTRTGNRLPHSADCPTGRALVATGRARHVDQWTHGDHLVEAATFETKSTNAEADSLWAYSQYRVFPPATWQLTHGDRVLGAGDVLIGPGWVAFPGDRSQDLRVFADLVIAA